MRRAVASLALPLVVLAVTGCGSSGPSAADKLAAKANAICVVAEAKSKRIVEPKSNAPSAVAGYFSRVADLLRDRHDRLAALVPPDSARAEWQRFLAADQLTVTKIDGIATVAVKDRPGAMNQAVGAFKTAADRMTVAANAAGAAKCAAGPLG